MSAFYEADGDGFVATELTAGPWDPRAQHGGPPSALITGLLSRHDNPQGRFQLGRVHIQLLRPVPVGRLQVDVEMVKAGRTVQRLRGRMRAAGRVVLEATALRIRTLDMRVEPPPTTEIWPPPGSGPAFDFPFFQQDVAYHSAIEARIVGGEWGQTPIRLWVRSKVPLVAGRATSPVERTLIIADAQSGMGVPCDPMTHTFVNPDLSVFFERMPQGEWLGFDIRSTGDGGVGLAQSAIRDELGLFARSAQTMVVAPRRTH